MNNNNNNNMASSFLPDLTRLKDPKDSTESFTIEFGNNPPVDLTDPRFPELFEDFKQKAQDAGSKNVSGVFRANMQGRGIWIKWQGVEDWSQETLKTAVELAAPGLERIKMKGPKVDLSHMEIGAAFQELKQPEWKGPPPYEYPYSITGKLRQFPYRFYWTKGRLVRYFCGAMLFTLCINYQIQKRAMAPDRLKAFIDEKVGGLTTFFEFDPKSEPKVGKHH